MDKAVYKSVVTLKSKMTFGLLNTEKKTAEELMDEFVEKGVSYQQTSGNITWYPPNQIEQVYFDYGDDNV